VYSLTTTKSLGINVESATNLGVFRTVLLSMILTLTAIQASGPTIGDGTTTEEREDSGYLYRAGNSLVDKMPGDIRWKDPARKDRVRSETDWIATTRGPSVYDNFFRTKLHRLAKEQYGGVICVLGPLPPTVTSDRYDAATGHKELVPAYPMPYRDFVAALQSIRLTPTRMP